MEEEESVEGRAQQRTPTAHLWSLAVPGEQLAGTACTATAQPRGR